MTPVKNLALNTNLRSLTRKHLKRMNYFKKDYKKNRVKLKNLGMLCPMHASPRPSGIRMQRVNCKGLS
jgi:hypothetical protein